MAFDFSTLKKDSNKLGSSLAQKALEQSNKSFEKDERLWFCEQDKTGTGEAIIRFLPPPKGEDLAWVKYFRHSFKGPTGKWYIENSLTTFSQPDPVAELNQKEWDIGTDAAKDAVRKRSRKTTYVSNIYVIKDKANPENEGKVFLFQYGKSIFDKLNSAMNPEFESDTPIVPFDFWQGANFKLRIVRKDGFANYDKSEFESISTLFDDDEKIEQIWNQQYSLQEFLDPKHFKSYDELSKRLKLVMVKPTPKEEDEEEEEDTKESVIPQKQTKVQSEPTKPEIKEESSKPKVQYGDDDDDDDIPNYFANLGKKD